MSAPTRPGAPITVRGGPNGIEARLDDLTELARLHGHAATDTGGTALALHGYLGEVVGTETLFDPVGALEFEGALTYALDGPGGVSWLAARCAELDLRLRTAVASYIAADRLDATISPRLKVVAGLPHAIYAGFDVVLRTGNPVAALGALGADDPELADAAVNLLGGPSGPLATFVTGLLADGRPALSGLGPDPAIDTAGPPRGFADVIAGLSNCNTGEPGVIDVRRLTGSDGSTSYIVDIPGTNAKTVHPSPDVTSVTTDLIAISGRSTSYERGVLAAMAAAGIAKSDRVMLVGHSEGGMIAVNAAVTAARSGRFNVTNVITAGAPIAIAAPHLPRKVEVLALENVSDVVPHTDGRENAPAPNLTTVTVHHAHPGIGDSHGLEQSYVPGARDVDASGDPSIAAYRDSAKAFFGATGVSTTRFVINRAY